MMTYQFNYIRTRWLVSQTPYGPAFSLLLPVFIPGEVLTMRVIYVS